MVKEKDSCRKGIGFCPFLQSVLSGFLNIFSEFLLT